ncbi:MAG: hypothetical protein AAF388_16035 [Bacteroidota bacterium]
MQNAFFNPTDELTSLYFCVSLFEEPKGGITHTPMGFSPMSFSSDADNQQVSRWSPLAEREENNFTFPTDKARTVG